MADIRATLDDYHGTTQLLIIAYTERSEALAAELTTRAAAYADLCSRGDRNITQIREEADYAAHTHKAAAIKLAGEIDAHLAHLRWLDVLIAQHAVSLSHT